MALVPRRSILFRQGEMPDGVYLVYSGKVRLTVDSSAGRTMTLADLKSGDVLGLGAIFAGKPHVVTAETLSSCRVGFLAAEDLCEFMAGDAPDRFSILELLSEDVCGCYRFMRSMGSAA